jgi:hypothetical protein
MSGNQRGIENGGLCGAKTILFAFLGGSLTVLLFATLTPLGAQVEPSRSERDAERSTRTEASLMSAYPAAGPIRIDGRLDEEAWTSHPPLTGFVQAEPVEGAAAVNDTEVSVRFDQDAIYVGARLRDVAAAAIARALTRRDARYSGQYDFFTIMLDPNLDGRTGYEFQVSAANVQLDRYLHTDVEEDPAWDAVWESAVTVDNGGWTVEVRIPFSQIRYDLSDSAQVWGANFIRRRALDNELSSFVLASRLVTGRVSQFGRLGGIRVTQAPSRAEIRPYVLGKAQARPVPEGDPFTDARSTEAKVGLDLRYGLGSSFTVDATVNPDFGQVEADPAVINLTALETRLEERRPFFVEDARIFDFSLTGSQRPKAFYSRRIGRVPQVTQLAGADFNHVPEAARILGAAKLTGRTLGGLSIGALAAVTAAESGEAYFQGVDRFEDFIAEPQTAYGVVRLRQDLRNSESIVGGIVTMLHRSLPGSGALDLLASDAFTVGVDVEHTWANREWAFSGMLAATHVRGNSIAMQRIKRRSNHYLQRPDLAWGSFDSDATSLSGGEIELGLERRRGRVRGSLRWRQIMPRAEVNELGFSTSPERMEPVLILQYRNVEPGRWFRDYAVDFLSYNAFSHEILKGPLSFDRLGWALIRNEERFLTQATLRNLWSVSLQSVYSANSMSRTETRGGPRMRVPGFVRFTLNVSTDNRRMLGFRPRVIVERGFLESGNSVRFSLATRVNPSPRLELEVEPSYSRSTNGSQYVTASGTVPYPATFARRYLFARLERTDVSLKTRLSWIFTPSLSLELYAQPLLSSGDYITYRQLVRSESYEFEDFQEGSFRSAGGTIFCDDGRTCVAPDGPRWVDLDGDGAADFSFRDRDFNVRSLRTTSLVRWEYRPGSTLFFVWQRRQSKEAALGDFDLGRDAKALFGLAADDVLMVKATFLLSL